MNHPHPLPFLLREVQQLQRLGAWRLCGQALLTGLIAGGIIGLFRRLYDTFRLYASFWLQLYVADSPWAWACILGGLALLAALAHLLLRQEPLISGSGIPQVELMAAGLLPPMRWGRVLWRKFVATLAALSAGLSVGREGPCIQMGACVGAGVGRLWHSPEEQYSRFLVGGSVAGLTAAFGAPVAGMFFAFEEMRSPLGLPLLVFAALSAVGAWAALFLFFDFGPVFSFAVWKDAALPQYGLALGMGLLCGLTGLFYNAVLIRLTLWQDSLTWPPPWLRSAFPFGLSALLLAIAPRLVGGVGVETLDLASPVLLGNGLGFLLLLLLGKIAYSGLSFASGVAGGLLMPMLLAGSLLGACVASPLLEQGWLHADEIPLLLVLGMGGMFAATVRAPLTGAALVVEMARCPFSAPAVLLTAFTASLVASRLGGEPVYDGLKRRILRRRALQAEAASVESVK